MQSLIDYKNNGGLKNGQILLVISSKPDVYAIRRAEDNKIDAKVVSKEEFSDSYLFDIAIEEILRDYNIDLIVLAGFLHVFGEDFTKEYSNRIINVHPSLIPSFCGKGFYGLKVHKAALDYGVKVTGATVHFANEICDGGEIIAQKAVEVLDNDTPETLQRRVMEQAEQVILPRAVEMICNKIFEERKDV